MLDLFIVNIAFPDIQSSFSSASLSNLSWIRCCRCSGVAEAGVMASRRNIAVTVHVVAALALLGVSTVVLVAGLQAATRDDARDAHAVYSLLRLLTFSLDLPLAAITLLSGVLLALTSSWGLFRHWWVIAKLGIYGATLIIGLVLISPSLNTMIDLTEAGSSGESGARSTLIVAAGMQVVILAAAAALGVFKPGRRVRSLSGRLRGE